LLEDGSTSRDILRAVNAGATVTGTFERSLTA
jgi:hypothetical protein